jgi:hypothetical protein
MAIRILWLGYDSRPGRTRKTPARPPNRVAHNAAAPEANLAAGTADSPLAIASANAPWNVSPQPIVSTTSTSKAGSSKSPSQQ